MKNSWTLHPPGEGTLAGFARRECLRNPSTRDTYHQHWTALRPGVGDLEFLIAAVRRDARRMLGILAEPGSACARKIQEALLALEGGLKDLRSAANGQGFDLDDVRVRRALRSNLQVITRLLS